MVSGKTWWDHYFEQGARTGTDPAAGTENWTDQGQRVNEDGSTSNVATTADGRTMVVTTQAVAGGTLTMTTVTDREGKVLRSHSTRSTSTVTNGVPATRNEQYDGDGRLTGSTTRTAGVDEHGNYTVTEQHRDAAGRVTGSTVESRDADGGRTTTRRDADGTVVREVVVGPDTSGAECAGEPARAAVDQLRAGR
jgi:hypothetical protein